VADEHRKISEFSIKGPGVVVYISTPRYLGGRGQGIMFEASLEKSVVMVVHASDPSYKGNLSRRILV
jgi:hypothetical protein